VLLIGICILEYYYDARTHKSFVLRTTLRYIHNSHECVSSLFFSRLMQSLELFLQIRLEFRLAFNSLNVTTVLEKFHTLATGGHSPLLCFCTISSDSLQLLL